MGALLEGDQEAPAQAAPSLRPKERSVALLLYCFDLKAQIPAGRGAAEKDTMSSIGKDDMSNLEVLEVPPQIMLEKPRIADPAPLGLAGLALAVFIYSAYNAGESIWTDGPCLFRSRPLRPSMEEEGAPIAGFVDPRC